jgi:hypothetical protein
MDYTTALAVSAMFGHSGDRFQTYAGVTLHRACVERGAFVSESRRYGTHARTRYLFPDRSAITVVAEFLPSGGERIRWWDLGFPGCYCWDTEGHILPDCKQRDSK